jgi:hypothetical protein
MDLEFKCPHCNESIFISQINCGIFRHGFLKNNLQQINPHASFEECENYIKTFNSKYIFQVSFNINDREWIVCEKSN